MIGEKIESRLLSTGLRRYLFAIILYAVVVAVASLLAALQIKLNLTILVVVGLVLAAWYGGRGPGILIAVLLQATTIILNPLLPDSSVAKSVFSHISVFLLLILIVLLISGRRAAEKRSREQSDQLLELNETLEERVKHRTLELEATNRELEAFSYSVSHDLRAPLRAVDGFSAILLEDYIDKIDEEGQSYLNHVRDASRQMGELIDDLLKLAKVSSSDISPENISLSDISEEILGKLTAEHPERHVETEVADDLIAYCDERLIRVLLQNLLENAWKFTSKVPEAKIVVGAHVEDGKTEYFVGDNGAGFDMTYAHNLFGPFQRLHSQAEFEGTGIGLATVERIVRRHGGFVRAEGSVGEGARFYFTLGNDGHYKNDDAAP